MDDFAPDVDVYCLNCQDYAQLARPPVEVLTKIGARRRLKGTCARCGNEVSCFLPSDDGPTDHNVRVGEPIKRELARAASLLDVSQRAVIENLVRNRLGGFVAAELDRLEGGGLITLSERDRRVDQLDIPIEDWVPPERSPTTSAWRARVPTSLLRSLVRRIRRERAEQEEADDDDG